jgi:hypothetical protein
MRFEQSLQQLFMLAFDRSFFRPPQGLAGTLGWPPTEPPLCGNAPPRRPLKPRGARDKDTAALKGRLVGSGPACAFIRQRPFLEAGAVSGLFVPRPLCAL